jgi:predicted anti-sigma-YlaC factor YlaD
MVSATEGTTACARGGARAAWIAIRGLALATVLAGVTGCSVSGFAVDRLGDALAAGGTTYAADDDPQFIAQAAPFSLKLMESLLAERPQHRGLLNAASAGFTQYAFAFLQLPADEIEADNLDQAEELRARARRMYARSYGYALRGLEVAHPGFRAMLLQHPAQAVSTTTKEDAGLLYWAAISLAATIGLSKDDPARVSELPQVQVLIDRVLELDEALDGGAIHAFLVGFTMVRPDFDGPRQDRAAEHFERARDLSGGHDAGVYVTWAEAVCVPAADRACFDGALQSAVAIDPDSAPERQLANGVLQRRARWLQSHADQLFLPPLPPAANFPEKRP